VKASLLRKAMAAGALALVTTLGFGAASASAASPKPVPTTHGSTTAGTHSGHTGGSQITPMDWWW